MNEHLDDILYPPIEPYQTGDLIVGDGNRVYWEQSGNPDGKPVVFLHGGPGAGTSPWHRRFFDPAKYRIILFDQRGCGRSTPHASEPDADLRHNTTWHLVADIELLRKNLAIDRWQIFGGSWGSALALAYAEAYPQAVTEIVLRGVFTLRRHELEWFYEGGASAIFPDAWDDFIAPIPVLERARMMEAYHRRLADPDPAVHVPAGMSWSRWEATTLTLLPDAELIAAMTEPAAATAFARIENHYFLNRGWFEEGQLIAGAEAIRDIPTVIVQGRYDVCTPPMTAWDLRRALPDAEFVMVPDAAHAASEPGIARALRAATDRFADEPVREYVAAVSDESESIADEPDAAAGEQDLVEEGDVEGPQDGSEESAAALDSAEETAAEGAEDESEEGAAEDTERTEDAEHTEVEHSEGDEPDGDVSSGDEAESEASVTDEPEGEASVVDEPRAKSRKEKRKDRKARGRKGAFGDDAGESDDSESAGVQEPSEAR
ncbi:proline iminopeptidase [Microbacterium terrae]|uniref:Proline iminopeptidase n=1 Tax=Microbacterium terrae TaxID=69369 RepID=A0A0M2H8F7_9MICO|nr:Proline iminopeptidase [Microbacterium terrae]MBP1078601.1 proline iminopeptidase [Microbacterium terrae]